MIAPDDDPEVDEPTDPNIKEDPWPTPPPPVSEQLRLSLIQLEIKRYSDRYNADNPRDE